MQLDQASDIDPISGFRSIEKRKFFPQKKERSSINLDIKKIQEGDSFHGSTGEYTFVQPPDYDNDFLESIVHDQGGKDFFLHTKEPERQALASLIGRRIIERHPEFASFRFPEIRLEKLNGSIVAFMEYFRNYEEVTDGNDLTTDEKAFLVVMNLWMGNWDFKEDHILASKNESHEFGLIDLEKSFDFDNHEFLSKMAEHLPFLSEISIEDCKKYIESIPRLDDSDMDSLLQEAAEAGIDPSKAQSILDRLIRRGSVLVDEFETVRQIHKQNRLIEEQVLGEAA